MFLLPRRRRSMLRLNAIFIIKYLSDNHCFIQKNLTKFPFSVGMITCQYTHGILICILNKRIDINYDAIYENEVAQVINLTRL